jgi:hypothetical protein
MSKVDFVLAMVGGYHFVEELSDCNVVRGEVLGHSDAIFTLEELGHSDIVGVEELADDVVKELSHRDVVILKEHGKRVVRGL